MNYFCTHHFFVSARLDVYSIDLKYNRERRRVQKESRENYRKHSLAPSARTHGRGGLWVGIDLTMARQMATNGQHSHTKEQGNKKKQKKKYFSKKNRK